MRKELITGVVIMVFAVAGIAHAQFGRGPSPKFYSEFKPVVGGWSEYQVTSKAQKPWKMKIAIVGKEGDAYWYETAVETKEGRMVSKVLVSGNPEDKKNARRMIVKMGNQPAMEMPVQMMQSAPDSQAPTQKWKMVDKGKESIKVPAGTFSTQHMQYEDGETVADTWLNKDISPYGMVKSQSKDVEMVLLGYGTGAKTLITETPQKFEMPQMPQMPQSPLKRK